MTPGAATMPLRRLQAAAPYVVVLAVGIFLYVQADNFEFEQASGRIGPGAWPKIILVMMVATALWGVVSSALRAGHTAPEAVSEAEQDEALTQLPEIYPALVWIADPRLFHRDHSLHMRAHVSRPLSAAVAGRAA